MKKLLTLLFVLCMSISLFGCSSSSDKTQEQSQEQSQTDEQQNSDTVTINHSRGVAVIPKNPSKIAVFDFAVLDTIDTLGIDNVEIAGPINSTPKYLAKYKETLVNGGEIKNPNIEELFNFQPQAIFINNRQADFFDELNKIAPTVLVELNADTYFQDFSKNVNNIADIFGKDASQYLNDIQNKIEEVRTKAENTDEKTLFIMLNNGKMSTYGKGSRFGIVFDTLALKPADDDIEVSLHGKEVSYEYVSEKNPDIILYIDRNDIVAGESVDVLNNPLIKETTAFKSNKIFKLDSEVWYLAGGGLQSVAQMIQEVENALDYN